MRAKPVELQKQPDGTVIEKPIGMEMCGTCGFVTYPQRLKDGDKGLLEYYREDYRKPPTINNLYAGQRKLSYHATFLQPEIKEWKDKEIDVCEIGAAYGIFLNWLRGECPKGHYSGTELTTSFRRVAFHQYGFILEEEIDQSKKYDMICSYKVSEHQFEPDKKLLLYKSLLKPGGKLYIAVPIWFDSFHNPGMQGADLEFYYSTNHVNVWTRKLFQTMLKKCGFKIIRSNFTMYDDAYLCVVDDSVMQDAPEYEKPNEIYKHMENIKAAFNAFGDKDFAKAIAFWPNYPDAWYHMYEYKRAKVHAKGFDAIMKEIIEPIIKACPDFPGVRIFCGDLCYRYGEDSLAHGGNTGDSLVLFKMAINYFNQSLQMRPNDAVALMQIGKTLRVMASLEPDKDKKFQMLYDARNATKFIMQVSMQSHPECMNWIYNDEARIPGPWEEPSLYERVEQKAVSQ